MTAHFRIGDIVTRKAFESSDGRWIPHTGDLTVIAVKTIKGTIPDYNRITATGISGTFEGAERFFQ